MDLTGTYIRSTDALKGTVFEDVTIIITEHNEKGAMGFIMDQPFGRTLNELEAFKHCKAVPLYNGGPVDQEHLFFIHTRGDMITEGVQVNEEWYAGGNFQQAVIAINDAVIRESEIRIFVGYCGWDPNELEAEIAEGSWEVM